ncbi:MAG: 16S rRNA (adenine(1518)-N(6)/adenine(1519)-N(6))-dimethyltransferase RsmA [Cytophagales bacterium]|nr:16S rRNA (adenine(1518)-N(6)/adenine(1519)-N(6))-dimethyltransferase RsmA [Cytophagales bacterium]
MKKVKAKKHLGQHFLNDEGIAQDIVDALIPKDKQTKVLEVGPGMGVLTKYLLEKSAYETYVAEIDTESVEYLRVNYPTLSPRIIEGDFLKMNFDNHFEEEFYVIGNFPYNISSQIYFKVLENKDKIPVCVGMIQKEVAERIASKHGNKTYGILSVLLQAYYDIEYLFTVHEHVFNPPPKVKSAVIRLVRNDRTDLGCDPKLFKRLVKQGFNNRRKTLRNALKPLGLPKEFTDAEEMLNLRAEQLSVDDFISLTNKVQDETSGTK